MALWPALLAHVLYLTLARAGKGTVDSQRHPNLWVPRANSDKFVVEDMSEL